MSSGSSPLSARTKTSGLASRIIWSHFYKKLLPQSHSAADDQRAAKTLGNSDVVAGLLYRPNERGRVLLKLPAGGCQRRAGFVADEEHAAELVFQRVDARADGRLADVKPVRGADEVSARNHRQKGPGELRVSI